MEAQRYPDDFDGIVSGAPVYDWTRALANGLKRRRRCFRTRTRSRPRSSRRRTCSCSTPRSSQACDAQDGVDRRRDRRSGRMQGRFGLAHIAGVRERRSRPALPDQGAARAIARVYAPLEDARGVIYEGQPAGGEAAPGGWRPWITGVSEQLLKAAACRH